MKTERLRTTISVSPEAQKVFEYMARVSGKSVSRCMGDWLDDTLDGAQVVALKIEQARHSPAEVMRDFHNAVMGLQAETISSLRDDVERTPAGLTQGSGPRRTVPQGKK